MKCNPEVPSAEKMQARYERARRLLKGIWTDDIARNTTVFPTWIGDTDCFWYVRDSSGGKEYRFVDSRRATNETAFDHRALAAALAGVTRQEVSWNDLPITSVAVGLEPLTVSFTAFDRRWRFDATSGRCGELHDRPAEEVVSPNGRLSIFRKCFDLWLRDLETGEERPITTDGEEHHVYGAVGSAWGTTMVVGGLQVRWSPDSTRLFTVQRDTSRVLDLPIVQHVPDNGCIRPTVEYARVAYPGDSRIEELRLLVIDVQTGQHHAASYSQIPVTRNSFGFFDSRLGWWADDSRRAWFVDVDKGYKFVRVVSFDTRTGETKVLFEETADSHVNLMLDQDDHPTLLPLIETRELLWFSERSGWAHLYLYDLDTGQLKRPVTAGEWLVRDVVHFAAARREVFVQTAARTQGRDPYYRDLVRINIDTGEMVTLASSDHDYIAVTQKNDHLKHCAQFAGRDCHASCAVSRTGNFAVVTRSRADDVPVSLLVDRDGNEVLELEVADLHGLPERWHWPEPIRLTAADGTTDIHGLVYRPSDFSPDNAYPVVSHVFNQPEIAWVPKGSFTNSPGFGSTYLDAAALAELGLIVVQIDGRGTPGRHKAFYDQSYGWCESASRLDDHIAGIRQLAERYPYMDLDRVGISAMTGGSGGVQGLLHYPEFYKVGVTQMFHDSRLMSASMQGNKYEGLSGPDMHHQYPEELAGNLTGKLLLMGGMLDVTTPPATIFRLVKALQKRNKDFDLILLPKLAHEASPYLLRRSWDYLVRHLVGVAPPEEFDLTGSGRAGRSS